MTGPSRKSPPGKTLLTPDQIIRQKLIGHAREIKKLDKQAGAAIVEIGRHLIEAKALVGHGNWLSWLKDEFSWTAETALRFMQVAEAAGKSNKLLDLDIGVSSLYLLAAPSTPPEAVDTVLARAETGEKMSGADVKEIIQEAGRSKSSAVKTPPPSAAFRRAEKMRKAKLKKDKAEEEGARPAKQAETELGKTLEQQSSEDADGHREALKKVLKAYGLNEVVAALIKQYGFDAVSDEVLEHNT
jgi:hypothetical protein